ncbi:head GIN domain-containing protein [uncultured Muriicola sp.]|uniref:head GIN domain-containing protein n=1 Tax=uncultured Muriicola sp. TaxID=1583102 RepID=UPI00262FD4AA|nr:head GIN domain-containing protein [uncultured Muriicola sp.]
MKKIITLTFILCIASMSYAQWGKKIKGNGKVVTIERATGDYESIAVSGWFDVELIEGAEGAIIMKGEENLLEYIITEVKDGKLVVKPEKGVNLQPSSWKSGTISVTIPVEEINAVSMSGSGDLVGKTVLKASDFKTSMSGSGDLSLDLEVQDLEVKVSGSGDMDLKGSTNNLEVQISGSGDVNAYGLSANNVSAIVSGSANIEVTANTSLKARVSGSGDISYRGNPAKIDSKTSGSGDISKG